MFDSDMEQRVYMENRWLAMERYRLQCAEARPDSPQKWATIAAIRSSMETLLSGTAVLMNSKAAEQRF